MTEDENKGGEASAPPVDTVPACMNPECVRNRGTLWVALGLAQRVSERLGHSIDRLDEQGHWLNELRRVLNEVATTFGAPAFLARLTGAQRNVIADVMRATGTAPTREESPPT